MRHILSLIIILLVTSPLACATTSKQRAIQFVVASDALADEIGDGWSTYVDGEIDRCRSTLEGTDEDTPEGRESCLGYAAKGDGLETALKALVAAQLAVELAVMCESNPLKVPQEFLHKCTEPTDWQALGVAVFDAWQSIRPFYEAMRKARSK
jgi:hypothetical protein